VQIIVELAVLFYRELTTICFLACLMQAMHHRPCWEHLLRLEFCLEIKLILTLNATVFLRIAERDMIFKTLAESSFFASRASPGFMRSPSCADENFRGSACLTKDSPIYNCN